MTIVCFASEKGGTGKTTFAVNAAGMRAGEGRRVALVDADRQGTAGYWCDSRASVEAGSLIDWVPAIGKGFVQSVEAAARIHEDIVIDMGAGDSEELRASLQLSDSVVIPVQASGFDVWTMGLLDELAAEARLVNPGLSATAVINRAPSNPRDRDVEAAADALEHCEAIGVARFAVRDRVAVRRSAAEGLTVEEFKPRDLKAVQELRSMYRAAFLLED